MTAAVAAILTYPAPAQAGLGKPVTVRGTTAYCAPQHPAGDITASGLGVRWGHVAVPMGSWLFRQRIYVIHGVRSGDGRFRRWFTATDRIGWGSQMDFWVPTNGCMWWGRRTIAYRVLY